MKIYVIVLEEEQGEKDKNRLEIVMVEAETSSKALMKAIELSDLENVSTTKVIGVFDNIEECKNTIVAEIETPYVHVDVW